MKNTKIVALVATVALLVLGAAFTSMAATYNWYQQDGEWRCADKNGDDYYDAWAKSGADWYWLDGEGWMAREVLVDDDTKYVDADGKMVKNDWKKIANDEGDEFWYYFQAGGKKLAAKEGADPKPVTVTGKKYIFNEAGQMQSGWVQPGFAEIDDADYAWKYGLYYCGDEEDGAVTYGWRQIECFNEAEDLVDNNYWFYFLPNGKKFFATADTDATEDEVFLAERTINGKKYAFNQYGVMKAEWEAVGAVTATATNAAVSNYAWFQSAEVGAKFANGWFRVVPSANFDSANNEDDTAKWFYAKSGKLAHDTIKTIAGKKYAFNGKGEMLTGLQLVEVNTLDEVDVYTFTAIDNDPANVQLTDIDVDLGGKFVAYFSDDEDNDGSMKTGLQKVTVDGDEYDFYFDTKNGSKGHGISRKQGNKYYYNGKKIAADDSKAEYQFFPADLNIEYEYIKNATVLPTAVRFAKGDKVDAHEYVLISKTGAVASSGTKKDGNGLKFTFKKAAGDYTEGYWLVEAE